MGDDELKRDITFLTPRRDQLGVPRDVTGKGIRIALIDNFFPLHRDLSVNGNRRIEWLDAVGQPFDPALLTSQYPRKGQHGLGKATAIGGTGETSKGHWCGVAPECDLVLLNSRILHGQWRRESYDTVHNTVLDFLWEHGADLGIRAINFAEKGDETGPLAPWQWDKQRRLCERLSAQGILVVSPTGNSPGYFNPPSLSPSSLAGGGFILPMGEDDTPRPYHSPEGTSFEGKRVPDHLTPARLIIFPSIDADERFWVPEVPLGHMAQEGVSFSCSCGVLACIWQKYPQLSSGAMCEVIRRAARKSELRFGLTQVGMPTWESIESVVASIGDWQEDRPLPFVKYEQVQAMPWTDRMEHIRRYPLSAAGILLDSLPDGVPAQHCEALISICAGSGDPRVRAALVLLARPDDEDRSSSGYSLLGDALEDASPLVLGCALDLLRRLPLLMKGHKRRVSELINHPDAQVRLEALMAVEKAPDWTFLKPLIEGMERELQAGFLAAFHTRRSCLEGITGENNWPETRNMLPGESTYSDYWVGKRMECVALWKNFGRES